MTHNRPHAPETAAAQALHYLDKETGAVAPPIHPTSTFARDENYELTGGYNYSRYESPTIDLAEKIICELERGAASQLFGSGLAAIQAVFETIKPGSHVDPDRLLRSAAREPGHPGLWRTLSEGADRSGRAAEPARNGAAHHVAGDGVQELTKTVAGAA